MPNTRTTVSVLNSPIDALSWNESLVRVSDWAANQESRYVCFCNVHSVVIADQDPFFNQVLSNSDMTVPDGAPVAWMLRKLGYPDQKRINGPDFMWRYLALASTRGESIYLYGSTPSSLALLLNRIRQVFPTLIVAGAHSPPFRALTSEEDDEVVRSINTSGAKTVWVSLGCPKQEIWMEAHRHRIHAVMFGVGAAFDYHSGQSKRAPRWMQSSGLEWLARLWADPRRLWRRYLVTNTLFLLGAARQMIAAPRKH